MYSNEIFSVPLPMGTILTLVGLHTILRTSIHYIGLSIFDDFTDQNGVVVGEWYLRICS